MTCFGACAWRICPRGAGALMAAGWVAVWCGVTGDCAAAGEAPRAAGVAQDSLRGERSRRGGISLLVEKSRYRLTVLSHGRALKSYPVVLGLDPVHDKIREGDGCTPEGHFAITAIRAPHRWSRFMLLSYPTAASYRRFATARRAGLLPASASIGGAVGIHGVPAGYDAAIERHENWTTGCVSLRTADIIDVARYCRAGTPVHIVR